MKICLLERCHDAESYYINIEYELEQVININFYK